jgi:tRNA threonylcarbamoyl adenosine modification protein YjeE
MGIYFFVLKLSDLSAGKSIFSRSFIQNLSESFVNVTSPTFTIENIYPTKEMMIHHIDLYRIDEEIDLYRLDWSQISKGFFHKFIPRHQSHRMVFKVTKVKKFFIIKTNRGI